MGKFTYAMGFSVFTACAMGAYAGTPTQVSIMAYNVENLFDATHDYVDVNHNGQPDAGDKHKQDYTYLPLSVKQNDPVLKPLVESYCRSLQNPTYRKDCYNLDWSESVLNAKVKQLGRMIKGASNGKGPDIIVLEEVENENVLRNYLVKKGLAGLGYNTIVIIEGPDSRGIDVAMISKYPLARPAVLHSIEVEDKPGFKTRGILEATFQVGDSKLTVLGNHWPSQQNPVETRVRAAQVFNQVAASIHDSAVIAAGDFNTLDSDTPNGIKQYVTNKHYNEWFFDAETEKRAMVPDDSTMNPGTHWYDGEWSSLDHIFLLNTTTEEKSSRGSGKDSELVVSWLAFEIYAPTFALTDKTSGSHTYKNIPKRFDPVKLDGYSDHLPVTMRVTLQN